VRDESFHARTRTGYQSESAALGCMAYICWNTRRTRERLPDAGSVAQDRVTVDPEVMQKGELKKGRPDGHPSLDCFGS
jgi:hypothetical protein